MEAKEKEKKEKKEKKKDKDKDKDKEKDKEKKKDQDKDKENGVAKDIEKLKEEEKTKEKDKKDKKDKKEKKEKKEKKDGKEESKVPEVVPPTVGAAPPAKPEQEEVDGLDAAFAMFDLVPDDIVAKDVEDAKKLEEEQAIIEAEEEENISFWDAVLEVEHEVEAADESVVMAPSAIKTTGDAGVFQIPPESVEALRCKMGRIVEMTGACLQISGTLLKVSGDSGTADASRYARAIFERRLDLEAHVDVTFVSVPQEWLEKWWGHEQQIEEELAVLILSESRQSKSQRVTKWRPNQMVEAYWNNSRWCTALVVDTEQNKVNVRWIFDNSTDEVPTSMVRVQLRVGIFGKPRERLKAEVKILEAIEAEVKGTMDVHLRQRRHGECLSLQPMSLNCQQRDLDHFRLRIDPLLPFLKKACGFAEVSFFRRPAKFAGQDQCFAMLAGNREERWLTGQVLSAFITSMMHRNKGEGKGKGTGMESLPPQLRGDMREVKIPQKCMGKVLGTAIANLRALMEETQTFIFALKVQKGKTTKASSVDEAMQAFTNNLRSGDYVPMCIFGRPRAMYAAELRLMATIEDTLPGYWDNLGESEQLSTERSLDVDKIWLPADFEPDANNIQAQILSAAAKCLVASSGKLVLIGGEKAERDLGREYMRWMVSKRLGKVYPKIPDLASRTDLLTIDVGRELIKSKWMATELTKLSREVGIAAFFSDIDSSTGSGKLVLAGAQVMDRDSTVSEIWSDFADICYQTQAWADGKEYTSTRGRRNRHEKDPKAKKDWQKRLSSDGSWDKQGWQDDWGSSKWNSSEYEVSPGVKPPATPAFGVRPPATPGIGVAPPATPALGVRPPATPAIGVAPPATPAFGVRPPATPAVGVAPPATPAFGVAPPATPMPGSFGPHGGRAPATPGMPGVAPPGTPGNFGTSVAPPATPGGFGPHAMSSPTTPGMPGMQSGGVKPPQTPAVGVALPQTPGVVGVKPPQTPAVGVKPPQTPAVGVKPPQTPAMGVRPPQTPGFAQHVPAPSTPAGLQGNAAPKRSVPAPATPANLGPPPEKRQKLGTSRTEELAAKAQEELRQLRQAKQGLSDAPTRPSPVKQAPLQESKCLCATCGTEFAFGTDSCATCGATRRPVIPACPKRRRCQPLTDSGATTASGMLRPSLPHWRRSGSSASPAAPRNAVAPSAPARPERSVVPATPARAPAGYAPQPSTGGVEAPSTPPGLRARAG